MTDPNKVAQAMEEINSNVKFVVDKDAIRKFFKIDTFIGFILIISILLPIFFLPWISLGNLQLVSGGTYADLLEEQVTVLREVYRYDSKTLEHLDTIDLNFSLTDMVSMSSNSWDSPARAIFRSQDEYIEAVEDAGYTIPISEFALLGDEIWLQVSVLGFIALTILGLGIFFASRPFGMNFDYYPIVFIALRIGRKGMYGLALLSLFLMILGRLVWLAVYMVPSVAALLSNQSISVQPYTMLDVLSWGFWLELGLITLLFALTFWRFLGKSYEEYSEKPKREEA
jgi:hypothetical protein